MAAHEYLLLLFVDKSKENGTVFRSGAKKLHRHMWLRNVRMWIIIGVILAAVLTVIVLFATGVIKT